MSPFAGDRVAPDEHLALDHDAGADTGTENHAEHHVRALPRAIDRLGKREAIGIVVQAHFAPERALEVLLERPADEPGGVRVLDEAGDARQRPGDADADAARANLI